MSRRNERSARRECNYCLASSQQYGSITIDGVTVYLCHPDEGQDCYRLVTVYLKPLADGRRMAPGYTAWLPAHPPSPD